MVLATVGALLRVMAALKPGGRMLEIGTETGIGNLLALDGMDAAARLTTVDIDPTVQAIARTHLGMDPRLTIVSEDAALTIRREPPNSLDLIFADAVPESTLFLTKHSLTAPWRYLTSATTQAPPDVAA